VVWEREIMERKMCKRDEFGQGGRLVSKKKKGSTGIDIVGGGSLKLQLKERNRF
jgi:hypothetical protein